MSTVRKLIGPTNCLQKTASSSVAARNQKSRTEYQRAFPVIFASNASSALVFVFFGMNATAIATVPAPVHPSAFISSARPNDAGLPISTVTQPLPGPLFFTPEQRARIDAARKRGVVILEEEVPIATTPPVMNGFLRRSDGQVIAWIDGKVHRVTEKQGRRQLVPGMIGESSTVAIKQSGVEPASKALPIVAPKAPSKGLSKAKAPKRRKQ